ncbi:MAG: UDP-N-acetylmuramate--L-alanine ligase [Candidatus Pacebacteria bacterium]|nr:UDP-N-acetylmuramate--L-alanine ligase [Candidatus Paceibacterota bacterium]
MKIDFKKINKIYFIGIGGIGLSAIAKFMKLDQKQVSGSDLNHSLIIDNLKKDKIKVYIGHSKDNITNDIELVIHTTAISKDNPELKRAKELNIKTITYPESLGLIFNNKFGIAVCGTHGKSSTSALAGFLLDDAKFDPSIVVGSILPRYKSNLRIGKSKYFVVEACEYERSFLNLYPKIIILNNIELDHTDYYKDIEDMRSAFEEFVGHLPKDGILICNGDDEEIINLKLQILNKFKIQNSKFKILSFGLDKNNDVRGCDVRFESGMAKFKVLYNEKDLGEFVLKVPGLFNIYNALGVITLGLILEIPIETIKKSLMNYSGIWRRFEIKGKYKNALVISDYAHHPTAVKATIEATRKFYPNKRILAVFQPHQHNRTKKLYKDFLNSFNDADIVILSEIFDVKGREESDDQNVSSLNLVDDIRKNWEIEKLDINSIFYSRNLEETRKMIDKYIEPNDILLIMGAGDIYKVADDLIK